MYSNVFTKTKPIHIKKLVTMLVNNNMVIKFESSTKLSNGVY